MPDNLLPKVTSKSRYAPITYYEIPADIYEAGVRKYESGELVIEKVVR